MPNTTPPKVRALCCECGNMRTVSSRYSAPHDANRTQDDNLHPQGWRCTMTLKCPICRRPARHAVLRDDDAPEFRDIAETRQNLLAGEGLPLGTFGTFGSDGILRHIHNISDPAGAEHVNDWCDVVDDPHRYFSGSSRIVEREGQKDVRVMIDGIQRLNGHVKRVISIAEGDREAVPEMTSDEARRLGAALIAAADEAENP